MKRVLIVDDAAFMRLSLKMMLERNGYEIVGEAENGAYAIEKYKELRPDVVTMDITMPEVDGIEALKGIKEIDPNSRILMVSSMGQESLVKKAILAGAKGFVVKPVKEENLIKGLSKL